METLYPQSPWFPFVSVDPDTLGGQPAFRDTLVPVQALFDYLKQGHDLSAFTKNFQGVKPWQASMVLNLAADDVEEELRADSGYGSTTPFPAPSDV